MELLDFFNGLQKTTSVGVKDTSDLTESLSYLTKAQQALVMNYVTKFMPVDIHEEFSHWAEYCFFTKELLLQYFDEYDNSEEPLCYYHQFPFFRIGGVQSNDAFAIDLRNGQFVQFDEATFSCESEEEWDDYVEFRADTLEQFADHLIELFGGLPYDE